MNKLNFLSLFLFSLIFASVFSFSLDEQNNYWKPAFVNSGYAVMIIKLIFMFIILIKILIQLNQFSCRVFC